jgi:hypothetical protein
METFEIKRNDRLPLLNAALKTKEGAVVTLSGASVQFHMKKGGSSTLKVDSAGSVVSATAGTVQYAWAAGDTDTAGDYEGEFEVTHSSGKLESFPLNESIPIRVIEDLG